MYQRPVISLKLGMIKRDSGAAGNAVTARISAG